MSLLKQRGKELERFDGLSLIYCIIFQQIPTGNAEPTLPNVFCVRRGQSCISRTLMGPYGVDRAVHSLEFTDCENGLGKSPRRGNFFRQRGREIQKNPKR
ncbi:unnamed protein product [Tetraodon nigroviridis]|uniref:(spotted green pufferfish) hypothetical protein n=1 Tax=Tetraodon nigroviridis TaxID=99883 RepID=Q4SEY2_TETNG|nr:unnamed protein product [Tetraodon nigroviridis]